MIIYICQFHLVSNLRKKQIIWNSEKFCLVVRGCLLVVCGHLLVVCGCLLLICGRLLVVCGGLWQFVVVCWWFVVVCDVLWSLPVLITTFVPTLKIKLQMWSWKKRVLLSRVLVVKLNCPLEVGSAFRQLKFIHKKGAM